MGEDGSTPFLHDYEVFAVRIRSLVALSAVTAASLLLAGCSGSAEPEPTPDASTHTPAEGCLLDAQPGSVSDAVQVAGEGADTVLTVPEDTTFEEIERTVLSTGTGEDVVVGDLISVRYQIVDGVTGEVLDSSARGVDGTIPLLLDVQNSSLFLAALECQPLGSRVVLALPGAAIGSETPLVVYAEALEALPLVASGTAVDPTPGMPTVTLDAGGAPTVTIPEGEAPAETQVALLKQGDGAVVGAGDLVVVQYRGVKWSDGTEFDSSWSRGAPSQMQTSQVVTGFRTALEGQQVGSQVLVVIPPADGYGDDPTHALAEETLVFVIDILATTPVE